MNRFSYVVALIAIGLTGRLLVGFIHPGQNVEANYLLTALACAAATTWVSVLRAQNAGKSPWIGAVVLVPLIGTLLFLYLLFAPPAEPSSSMQPAPKRRPAI